MMPVEESKLFESLSLGLVGCSPSITNEYGYIVALEVRFTYHRRDGGVVVRAHYQPQLLFLVLFTCHNHRDI